MYFEESERKLNLKPCSYGMCKDCIYWDDKEIKPQFRACLKTTLNGEITMICRSDDICKSFQKKK